VSGSEPPESSASHALATLLRVFGRTVARTWHALFPRRPETPRSIHQTCFEAEVPCQGDAFSFRVTIRELWTRSGEPDALGLAVRDHIKPRHMAVEQRLRAISRRFPPEAAEAFENAANTELGEPTLFPDDPDLDCSYSVHAALDGELRTKSRDAEIKRLNLEQLDAMQKRWLEFLRARQDDPLVPLATQLAGDQTIAEAIAKYRSEEEQLTDQLHKILDSTSEAYREKDVFEFVQSTESALGRLLSHLRIDGTEERDGQ
jgi:hypothetical protein